MLYFLLWRRLRVPIAAVARSRGGWLASVTRTTLTGYQIAIEIFQGNDIQPATGLLFHHAVLVHHVVADGLEVADIPLTIHLHLTTADETHDKAQFPEPHLNRAVLLVANLGFAPNWRTCLRTHFAKSAAV